MNNRSTTLLVALAMSLALSASPTLADTKVMEISGLKMEVDVVDMPASSQATPAVHSSKPKEIVVVGSKTVKPRTAPMAAWHEAVIVGDVAAARSTKAAPRAEQPSSKVAKRPRR